MDIIFIASLKNYTTAISLIKAFQNQHHNVVVLSDLKSEYINVDYLVDQSFNIQTFIMDNNLRPNLVIFCEGGSMKLFPRGLENLVCKTAWYGIDTHMDLQKHLLLANFFDVTFLAQKEYLDRFISRGFLNTFWLPLAYDITMSTDLKLERIYDIAYVGSNNKEMHFDRFKYIEKLQKAFPNSYFGLATGEDMYKIYSQSKLVFNKSVNNDVNMRYFEALGNGAMLLTDVIIENGVEELFEKGTHFIEYNENNIVELANQYIRSDIDNSLFLQKYIKQSHTYDNRISEFIYRVDQISKMEINISYLDYAKVFLFLENYAAFIQSLIIVINQNIILGVTKRKIAFAPLLFTLKFSKKVFKYFLK